MIEARIVEPARPCGNSPVSNMSGVKHIAVTRIQDPEVGNATFSARFPSGIGNLLVRSILSKIKVVSTYMTARLASTVPWWAHTQRAFV